MTICFPNMVLLYSSSLSFRNYLTFKKQRREAENGENFTTTAAATNPGSAAGSNTKANEIGFTIVHCCSPSRYSEEIIEIILQRTKKILSILIYLIYFNAHLQNTYIPTFKLSPCLSNQWRGRKSKDVI